MPELPEVETIVRYLRPRVRGKEIQEIWSNTPRLFRDHRDRIAAVKRLVEGRSIVGLERVGKNIIFVLNGGQYLILHLMMSGILRWNPSGPMEHDRMRMTLSGDNTVVFHDPRAFGRCRVAASLKGLGGPDALMVSLQKLREVMAQRRGSIKHLLLDQKVVAGIGNIYADEILWHAGIHPLRRGDTLTQSEMSTLYASMRGILKKAVRKHGSSMTSFVRPDGAEGRYYDSRHVYRRAGEPCARDGTVMRRIIVSQRSTHFCPGHQV